MTAEEFEAWWSKGRLAKEWFDLSGPQQVQALNVKLLFKEIATGKDVDAGVIFALMSLASDLSLELIRRRAYRQGRHDVQGERRAELLRAIRTLKENPLAAPLLKTLAVDLEPVLTAGKRMIKRNDAEIRQEALGAAVKSSHPDTFLNNLMLLDSMPGAKHSRHLRSFFACLFAEHCRGSLVAKIIKFCFGEKGALRQARAEFNRSFPNWRGVAKQLFKALQPPKKEKPPREPSLAQ